MVFVPCADFLLLSHASSLVMFGYYSCFEFFFLHTFFNAHP